MVQKLSDFRTLGDKQCYMLQKIKGSQIQCYR